MTKKEIEMLIKLRDHVIHEYSQLQHRTNPAAMTREMDSAYTLETIVKSLEDVLRPHVTIS